MGLRIKVMYFSDSRHRHKYLLACPGKWVFDKRAFWQVDLSFHLPKWASWFSEHQANDPNIQKYANNATKLKGNGFQIIKSMINNTCLSNICYKLCRASQKLFWASKNHQLLVQHGKLLLKIMLVPGFLRRNDSWRVCPAMEWGGGLCSDTKQVHLFQSP